MRPSSCGGSAGWQLYQRKPSAAPSTDAQNTVSSPANGSYPDASYTLRIRKLVADPLAFDGGSTNVINQTNLYQFFRVDVPANAQKNRQIKRVV